MRNLPFFLIIACCILLTTCHTKEFRSDVKTDRKPWTTLSFNNDHDNFRFAIMSDRNGGNRPGIFEDAVTKVNLMQPEFVMCVGDLIAGYTTDTSQIRKEWEEVNETISELEMPFFYLPGNHDISNEIMANEWEKRYGRRYYHFVYRNTLFITLDSNDDEDFSLTREQTDFVLNTLQSNSGVRWTFLFMHHPIWIRNTDGRFNEIEEALKGRKFTVIAGHTHQYHHAVRNGGNYYILSTTGAGNSLRGNYFGEFDHISWITMTNDGPVMANLRLDGILPHDIANENTREMARHILANAKLTNILLCNRGTRFTNGTLCLLFENPAETDLEVDISFFHHHQLQVSRPEIKLVVEGGARQVAEIPLSSSRPLDYRSIDLLSFDWEMKYISSEYKGFGLQGKFQVEVKPSETNFIDKGINCFTDRTTVGFIHGFTGLESRYALNNSADQIYVMPIEINKTTKFSFFLKNNKNEITAPESRIFEKISFREPIGIDNPEEGLEYNYYEGEWQTMPDFRTLEPKATGVADNFLVKDLSLREDHWGLVYTGYFKADSGKVYIFGIRADDACRFYIDGTLVVGENIVIKGENVGAIALEKGFHPVRIEFLEKQGNERLRFYTKNREEEDWEYMESGPFYH